MEKETTWQMGERYGKMKEEVKEHFSQLWSKKETGEKIGKSWKNCSFRPIWGLPYPWK